MKDYLPESMRRCPPGYARGELERAMEEGTILTARAVRCDETHDLIIDLGCAEGRIPRLEAAEGVADGRTREIAILRCVGRPVCACVTEITPEGEIVLSRRKAQQLAMDHLLREAAPGDILPAVVTGCTAFGAFCDVGCGAAALLGTQQLCISRLRHAGELLTPGQRIYAAIRTLDRVQRRVFLTQRELLGTWAENAARFCAGQTVIGVARSLTDYGAFIELTGVEEKTADGKKVDNTTADAEIANKTDVVLTSVAGNEKAIGYISLGALNDTVKAVKVDGAEATVDNVKAGAYKLSRPFNIATKGEPTGVAKDFISFILSKEGQAVVTDNKYIAVNDAAESFVSDGSSGQIAVGGSSSVSPVMEKLIEAYKSVNPNASIDLQTSDSTSGMTGAMDGTFAIGMASRELKDEEAAQLTGTAIALDGIAVIVNPANTIDELSMDQIKSIYVGDITDWGDLA